MNCMGWLLGPTLVVLLVTHYLAVCIYSHVPCVSPEPGPAPGVRLHQRGVLLPRLQRARQQVVRRQEGRAQRCRTDSAIKNQYISISLFQLVVCGNLRRSILTARRCSGSVKGYTDTPSPADGHRINKTLLVLIIVFFCSL